MKYKKSYPQYLFLSYCILISIIKLSNSPFLIFKPWIIIGVSVCAILLIHFILHSIYWGNHFWSDVSSGSLLFLAVPSLVWLYTNTLISYNHNCDLFLICGICLCLQINFYSHDTFIKTSLTGILFCVGGLWLAVRANMTIWGLFTICAISFLYVSSICQEYYFEEDIKYNRFYIIIILVVSEYSVLSSTIGVECICFDLLKSSPLSLSEAVLLYMLNYGPEYILLLISLFIIRLFHNKVGKQSNPSTVFSYLILEYLIIEKWNYCSVLIFIVVVNTIVSLQKIYE